jgi:aminoglycoside phosphotransferase (APT) family kinase protein
LAPTITQLRPLAGGASSLTYTGERARQRVVVKVAPPGVEPIAHRDVLRQSRIIRALGPTPVPVPRVLFEDKGDPPGAPPLFVMSYVKGNSLEPLFDARAKDPESVVAERFRQAAATMAHLHGIAPDTVGLASEPAVGPAAEVERWCRTLETVDAALVPKWREVAGALRSSIPAALPPAIVHGDFRLGNVLALRNRITAVIDWEIWSVGDPRVDVGWFLINCDTQTYRRATPYCGVTPPPSELVAIYAHALGRDVPDLDWFKALACFKSTATWALIVKHNRRRRTPAVDLEAMASGLPDLLSQARRWLG